MKRGRKALPTDVKRARGNPGRRKLNDREPKFARGLAIPPYDLGAKDEGAARIWAERIRQLEPSAVITAADHRALAALCWIESLEEALLPQLEDAEPTIVTEKGEYANPLFGVVDKIVNRARLMRAEFGLTPSSRAALHVGKEDDPDLEREMESARPLRVVDGGLSKKKDGGKA